MRNMQISRLTCYLHVKKQFSILLICPTAYIPACEAKADTERADAVLQLEARGLFGVAFFNPNMYAEDRK